MKNGPRILLVDSSSEDRALSAVVLAREFPNARIVEVQDASTFALELSRGSLNLVVTAHDLGWSDGLSVLETVRESHPEVPVVMFTHQRDEELAVRAMKAGLADYLVKSSKGFLRLAKVVRGALENAKHHQQVARSQPWLQTLLDRANVGVLRSTLDQRLIEANPAALRLLGVNSLEEALEMDLPTHYFQPAGREDLEQRLSADGDLQARVLELERRDGTKIWLSVTEVLLLDVDGDIVVDVLLHDISHVKGSENDLVKKVAELERSNADLSDFASVASHELKAPLRAINRYGALLARDLGENLGVEERRSLDIILDGTQRMQGLVDGLLGFSRLQTGWRGFKACDCNTLVDNAIHTLQDVIEESGASIGREGLPTVLADATELQAVFQNLISNAIRFRSEHPPIVTVRASQHEEEWRFSVEDNGIGLDPGESDKIFRLFGRLHPEGAGSGIGLTICQRIVERHGGRIWVESAPGEGSTFTFSLPMKGRASGESAGKAAIEAPMSKKG